VRLIFGDICPTTVEAVIKNNMTQLSDNQTTTSEVTPPANAAFLRDIRIFSRFRPTLKCVARNFCQALILPIILFVVAMQMGSSFELTSLEGCLQRALLLTIPTLFVAIFLTVSMRRDGLAEKYYGWSPVLCDGLHRFLQFMVWMIIPLNFFCRALETFDSGRHYDSLGRMFFIGAMASATVGLYFACRGINRWRDAKLQERGLNRTATERRRSRENLLNGGPIEAGDFNDPWLSPIRRFALMVIPPGATITLLILSAIGYHFTAVEMSWRAKSTVLVSLSILVVTGLVSRLLLTTQFRIKLRQLNRNESGHIQEEESINIEEISDQVNRLLRVSAIVLMVTVGWQVWAEVSPTINFLNSIELWESATKGIGDIPQMVTMTNLLVGCAILVMTWALSKNLPGLLEITLLERLPLDKGGRYAISFVVRYLVGLLGILCTFHVIGFAWSSVQWLAAGLTLGLGFGLQEIFANLVSGIIILIERPVRVGDVVTVSGTTGTVTHMQLRATTIRDVDMRELIVPNKKFITEDVMNWTLTDQMSRLILTVGVAYKSDTKAVQAVLLGVARKHTLVLNYPSPEVVFKSFGDSTLDFELRVMVVRRDHFPKVQHDLNMAIDAAFQENGIEIAFPQREIRVVGGPQEALALPVSDDGSSPMQKAG
jgi:potassium efflux system protein